MYLQFSRLALGVAIVAGLLSRPASGQTNDLTIGPGAETGTSANGAYRVSSFTFKSFWAGAVPVPLQNGDPWTPEKQSQVLEAIRNAYSDDQSQSYLLHQAGEIGVFYVDVVEEKDNATHTVKLTFRPLQVRLSLTKLGDNVLPIPRSPTPTRYEALPPPLRALNPTFGVTYDRAFGTAVEGALQCDLLTIPDAVAGRLPNLTDDHHLNARFNGAKSFDEFYRANAGLDYSYRRIGEWLQEFTLGADYDGAKEPLDGHPYTRNSGGALVGGTLNAAAHTRLTLNLGYRHADDRLETSAGTVRNDTEIEQNRVFGESLLPEPVGGFLRAALWEDNGWTHQDIGSHQRLVGRAGYAREVAIAPNQTIGLELVAGGGKLWGAAPPSRRFFGGNSAGQFLYDDVSSPSLVAMPAGPLIRSFGQGEAVGTGTGSANGGDAFWHVNLNLTIPIRPFSFPLIPQDDEVRGILKNGINVSGRSFLISTLKQQGMTHDEAVAEADRTLNTIRPATEFIIDEANLYAVKPLLMFDAAGISGAGQNATWTAAGAGVQLTIVTARFELGYMHTLTGPTAGDRGNIFARLVFQKLF